MNALSHVWSRIQETLFPALRETLDPLSERQEKLIAILEIVGVEDFVGTTAALKWVGRPLKDRQAIARAFVAKTLYGMPTTKALIERLGSDKNFRRICGFERRTDVPKESTFSRAFGEFAKMQLSEKVHEALIAKYQSPRLVGHIARDATEIVGREKPAKKTPAAPKAKRKRGRPKKAEVVAPKAVPVVEQQKGMTLEQMVGRLPNAADRGSKKNSKGYFETWNGYKLHIDTADGEIPISCILTSASVHDSQVAIPLARMTEARVTNLYDLMDAAYDSPAIHEVSRSLGHVPIIDHNRRRGEKKEMDPATAVRYNARTSAERVNARLKDEFGGRTVRVRGAQKVMAHLMFGILVLAADQLLRLVS
jgi:hypothetical protein